MAMGFTAKVTGSFAGIMEQHAADGRRAVTVGVHGATTGLKDTFRAQVRANFASRKLPTTWQDKKFPQRGESLGAAGLVFSRSPEIILYYTAQRIIVPKAGRNLVIPTGFNVARGRRGRAGVRVTPQQMRANPKAFVIKSQVNSFARLWCLPLNVVKAPASNGRARTQLRLAGSDLAVGTGKDGGRAARRKQLIRQGFVPMFLLLKAVGQRQRVDIDGPVRVTDQGLPQRIVNSWRDGAGKPRPIPRSFFRT